MSTPQFTIRYADGDDDVNAIFRFLVIISRPARLEDIDKDDSITEVNRVVYGSRTGESFAIMAEIDGEIVGSVGIIKVPWWYNTKKFFLTDRWLFVYPVLHHKAIGASMLAEVAAVAHALGMKPIINGKPKPRNAGSIYFEMPAILKD